MAPTTSHGDCAVSTQDGEEVGGEIAALKRLALFVAKRHHRTGGYAARSCLAAWADTVNETVVSRPGPTETGGSSRMLAAKDAGEPCREAGARFEPGGGEETRPAGPTQPHGPDASHRPDTLTARFRSGPRPPLPEGSEPVPCRLGRVSEVL
jgi:hypothetical protein